MKLPNSYNFRAFGEFRVRFASPITLMGKGSQSTRVGGQRSSEEWSRSDETCADNVEGFAPQGPPSGTTSSNPTANLTATLTAAGISSSEINTMTTDFQNLKNAMTTTDPALQAKIAADKAAIVQDGGPSLPTNAHGFRMPGMF